jgi:hypothetical protein
MRAKRMPAGKRRVDPNQALTLGDVMSELSEASSPAPLVSTREPRARRAGPFKVPASIVGTVNSERAAVAKRFKQHLRGVSGANKLGPDPDETVPVVRLNQRRAPRSEFGFRPGMPSRFGRPLPSVVDDEDDE